MKEDKNSHVVQLGDQRSSNNNLTRIAYGFDMSDGEGASILWFSSAEVTVLFEP